MSTIRNTEQLRRAIARGQYDYAILLAGGVMKSSKYVTELPNKGFRVYNYVDSTRQFLSARQLYTHSNIGEAMLKGAFVAE